MKYIYYNIFIISSSIVDNDLKKNNEVGIQLNVTQKKKKFKEFNANKIKKKKGERETETKKKKDKNFIDTKY